MDLAIGGASAFPYGRFRTHDQSRSGRSRTPDPACRTDDSTCDLPHQPVTP